MVKSGGNYLISIRPERDFSTDEIEMTLNAGFKSVSLGDSHPLTKTAGLVVCQTFNSLNENTLVDTNLMCHLFFSRSDATFIKCINCEPIRTDFIGATNF